MLKRFTFRSMARWITFGLLMGLQTSAFGLSYALHPIAVEGDTLPDGSTLGGFPPEGTIAINDAGQVAFIGQTASLDLAVFTNEGVVAAQGDTLPDGSTIAIIFLRYGEMSFNDSGEVAFFGRTGSGEDVVFTSTGVVAAEGDTLPDGSTIDHLLYVFDNGISLNDSGQVAFLGMTGPGEYAVFTNEGVVAAQGDTLPDGSTIDLIYPDAAISLNNSGQVAFHGNTAAGEDTVFTNEGVVAARGDTLPDGTTIERIGYGAGISLNDSGQVAFQAWTATGELAVFTNEGLVAADGDTLPDGSTIHLNYSAHIAISLNDSGQVAFLGYTASGKTAVFTNEGLVAASGDTLPDGSTLGIDLRWGVAVNDAGQIAFRVLGGDNKFRVVRADPMTALVGDLDGDGDIDSDDVAVIVAARGEPATGPDDPRDLDGDGVITALDARLLVLQCTRPYCATE
jgi:hypothetical protein